MGPIFRGSASNGRFLNVVDFWVTCSTMTSRRKNKKNSSKFLHGFDWSSRECMWGQGSLNELRVRISRPKEGENASRKEKVSGDKLWLWRPRSGLLKRFNLIPKSRPGTSASARQWEQQVEAYPQSCDRAKGSDSGASPKSHPDPRTGLALREKTLFPSLAAAFAFVFRPQEAKILLLFRDCLRAVSSCEYAVVDKIHHLLYVVYKKFIVKFCLCFMLQELSCLLFKDRNSVFVVHHAHYKWLMIKLIETLYVSTVASSYY